MIPALLGLAGSALAVGGSVASNSAANDANATQNELNRQFNKEILGLQNKFNMQAAEDADARQRRQWFDLYGPEATREQLENAGLSVGLMYGGGSVGGGSASSNQTTSGAASTPNTLPMNPIFDANTANILADAALKQAQKENIEKDTENKDKDLSVKDQQIENCKKQREEIDQRIKESNQKIKNLIAEQEKTMAEKSNVEQDTKVKEATEELTYMQKAYLQTQDELLKIDVKYTERFKEAELNQIKANINKLNWEAKKAKIDTQILQESKDSIVQGYAWDVLNKMAVEAKTKEETELLQQTIERVKTSNGNYQTLVNDIKRDYEKLPEWAKKKTKLFYDVLLNAAGNMQDLSKIAGVGMMAAGAKVPK